MEDQSRGFTPEEAISAIGFGKFHCLVLIFAGFGWISEAMGVMLLPIVGIAVKSEWGISPGEESLLTTVVFAGMLIGSYVWGIISDAHGRRKGFISVATVVAVTGICSAFSPNYVSLLVSRCLLGFGVGGGHVFAAWFLEFIPTHSRGAWAFALASFWSFGTILEASLVWIIMPRFGWRWLIAVSCFPSFLVLLLSSFTPESPRYLCVKGKMGEARKILEGVASMNRTSLPPGILVLDHTIKTDEEYAASPMNTPLLSSVKHCSSDSHGSPFFALFSPKLWRATLLLWILYFAITFSYYGVVFLSPELSNRTAECGSKTNLWKYHADSSLYRDNFITALADLLGLVISATIVDRLGRKHSMAIFSFSGFILFLPLIVHQDGDITTALLLFGARLCISSSFSVFVVYIREVYPTQVRATGVGTATSIGSIGSMICPMVAVGLVRDCHQTAAIVLFEAMGDQSMEFTPEEAISAIGFGKYQVLVLIYAGIGWISEAMEMMLLSIVGIAVESEWGLSPGKESLLSTVVFAGMLVGAYVWGIISDAFGRRRGFIGTMVVVAVAALCSAFSPSYRLLLASRCLLGFGVGGGHVFAAWFLEFIPAPNRGAWAFVLTCFWSFGSVVEASLIWIIMPRLGWRWLIALSSIPSWLVIFFSGLTPESPRYLCVKGKMDEARRILEKVATTNKTKLPPGILILDQTIKRDEEHVAFLDTPLVSEKQFFSESCLSSLVSVLSSKLRKTTLLLWILYLANTFAYYGMVLLSSELSNRKSNCTSSSSHLWKNGKDSSLYRAIFITSLADLPGTVISGAIVDRLGRKQTMKVFCALGFILLLPLSVHQNEIMTTALLFGARMFVVSTFNVIVVYSREVYPTTVRATGVGIATSIGRIGGMICPLVAVGLVRGCHQTTAVLLFEAVILLIGFCIPLLPIETSGKGLSDTLPPADDIE
ncbi:OLC1v1035723C1 [Oldenlandia corymbosa var. corymbosa]|uniref:OLC1v1035723C1 n=1 Tax=Oldenlandia corymbosa var. corymbosa TaxID=529605 RepID=A0AAV1CTQ2_OLDCO|nr:OLC1v1035723C1 [Oldenlandia corymbosa var. corymbosa]